MEFSIEETNRDSLRSDNGNRMSRPMGMLAQLNRRNSGTHAHSSTSNSRSSPRNHRNSFKQISSGSSESCRRLLPVFWTVFVLAIIVSGIAVALTHSVVGGWSLVGVGFLFAILGLILSKYWKVQRKKTADLVRLSDAQPMTFYHTNIEDFPADPVLQRGVTHLVYHGHADCELCTRLREEELMASYSMHEHQHDPSYSLRNRKVTPRSNVRSLPTMPTAHNHPETLYDNLPSCSNGPYSTEVELHEYEDVDSDTQPSTSTWSHQDDRENSVLPSEVNTSNNNSAGIEVPVPAKRKVIPPTQPTADSVLTICNPVTTRDSILTTKKRRHIRNKEWDQRRKTAAQEQNARQQDFSLRSGVEMREMTTSMESLSRIEHSRNINDLSSQYFSS